MLKREEASEILEKEGTAPFPSRQAKLFFSISYYTGFSVDILRELTWAAVNETKAEVSGGDKKRPLTDSLKPYIEELKEEDLKNSSGSIDPGAILFHNGNGKPLSEEWIVESFEKTMESAGIDYKKRKLVPNSFRRTYNFWFA